MIEDQDKGGRSVTNNIHQVVLDIAKKEFINPVEHNIIYRDSEKIWDGYNFSTKTIFPLREIHWLQAAIKALEG